MNETEVPMNQHLNLRFKGAREYLQGPDIYNALFEWVIANGANPPISDVDLSIHRIVSRQLDVVEAFTVNSAARAAATCSFTERGARRHLALIETEQPVTERYPYDEDSIVRQMVIDAPARSGKLSTNPGFSPIEIWVAMTKAVHIGVFGPSIKWLFVRARLEAHIPTFESGDWTTTIAASFRDKLTRNEIAHDGKKVGDIFFAPKGKHAGH